MKLISNVLILVISISNILPINAEGNVYCLSHLTFKDVSSRLCF